MSQIIFSPAAIRDMQRLRDFLRPQNPDAARRAGNTIRQGLQILSSYPLMGHVVDNLPRQYREWLIDFGNSGYVVRYRLDKDMITILAVRHQREAGY